ncbi:hypothetical protein COCMIDRAFT_89190 [Bipolaris oryzae ATCC 44560]|uniref:Uncharacterized protein n=1 Tax=Bipolaris oryzae ATCC 44560 TaxID=930090 RepID=W6ZK50_COCMI|nr:uncharacterized protein COCMIDRAFT_89190 [Bipolaris oryzae ATCC 44560]EUC47819.1 hypothetical protein COCMIDRAFT_89190 [Bipolaris oryzae ATCC 44560]
MDRFNEPKSSLEGLLDPLTDALDHTLAVSSAIVSGVDPPRISLYEPMCSIPYDWNDTTDQSDAIKPTHLTTISKAIPPTASAKDRSNKVHENWSTPHPLQRTVAGVNPREDTPKYTRHAPVQLKPTSLANSVTSTDFKQHAHPQLKPKSQTTTPRVDQSSVLPPTQTVSSRSTDSLTKPTCSLNLMCYRSGSQGCVRRQIHVLSQARLGVSRDDYSKIVSVKNSGGLIRNDKEFFAALHREYEHHICGFWRRYLSLKTLRQIRLLSYTPSTRPEVVPMDDFTLQEIFYAYQHFESIKTESEWIEWVFRLRQADRRHALEFVEDWSGFRIGLVGSVPWVAATVVGVAWTARGGDAQTAFTVAGFILTVGTSLLALLAIISKIES